MHPVLRSALLLSAVSAALSACSDGSKPTPTAPVLRPTGVNASLSLTCDFNTLKSNVRSYVASGNDIIFDIISAQQKAVGKSGVGTVSTGLGFDGLARLAIVRADPALKKAGATAAQGAAAVTSFLGCMDVGPVPDEFAVNIVNSMDVGGMFEVPGSSPAGAGASTGVFSRGETPFWGAQPAANATWAGSTNKRFLMYGFKIPYGTGQGILDPLVNAGTTLNGFDFNTLPVISSTGLAAFNPKIIIGACGLAATSTARIIHKGEILAGENLDCPAVPPVLGSVDAPVGGFANVAWLARKALSVFTPQPLNATAMVVGIAGGRGELSPTAAVLVAPTATFVSQPLDGFVRKTIPGDPGPYVRVLAQTSAGTPLRNATVTILVANNSGTNVAASGAEATTGTDGIASFPNLSVNKAGGYTLTATVNFDNLTASKVSNLFNIQNKTP